MTFQQYSRALIERLLLLGEDLLTDVCTLLLVCLDVVLLIPGSDDARWV